MSTTHPFIKAIQEQRQTLSESYQRCYESADKVKAALRPRVLYLEDDSLVARSYQRILAPSAEVMLVGTAPEARSALAETRIDLILTDSIGLPLLGWLQKEYPDLPVIVISGKEAPASLPKGVSAWHRKPVDADRLAVLISTYAKGILE